MTPACEIRRGRPDDRHGILAMYPEAFPDEDLVPLVQSLLDDPAVATSLVAVLDGRIIGHVIFTRCRVERAEAPVALLGPLGVAPAQQGLGIGSRLVRAGLQNRQAAGVERVLVLGDPAYYSRFGFEVETKIQPPYQLPAEWTGAWQSLAVSTTGPALTGRLRVPAQWQDRALWST